MTTVFEDNDLKTFPPTIDLSLNTIPYRIQTYVIILLVSEIKFI